MFILIEDIIERLEELTREKYDEEVSGILDRLYKQEMTYEDLIEIRKSLDKIRQRFSEESSTSSD